MCDTGIKSRVMRYFMLFNSAVCVCLVFLDLYIVFDPIPSTYYIHTYTTVCVCVHVGGNILFVNVRQLIIGSV